MTNSITKTTEHLPLLTADIEARLSLADQFVFYRIFKRQNTKTHRRLLLLHGGGLNGLATWEHIIPHLEYWDEILAPDLRGGGNTHYPDHLEHDFEAEEVVEDVYQLLEHLNWEFFDIGGYSFGGFISMLLKAKIGERIQKMFLLEPALFTKQNQDDNVAHRDTLMTASYLMRDPKTHDKGLETFLDAVAPNRTRGTRSEATMKQRLSYRPGGLASAILCLSKMAKRVNRDEIIAHQAHVSNFVGERTNKEVYNLCKTIASGRKDWICHLVQGADHAMPFQKPLAIAQCFNADMQRYLEQRH